MSNKLFSIPPSKVKVVIIVANKLEDNFLSFLFNLGYSWVERDLTELATKLEHYGILLLRENDSRIERLFKGLYDVSGIIYYGIGTKHLFTVDTVDPFIHNIFVNKSQWKDFNTVFKNFYEKTFEELLLKEIK